MPVMLLEGPASEPVSLAEAKAHLKLDTDDEDALVQTLIVTARLHVEALCERVLISQKWRLVCDAWPAGRIISLRIAPLKSVDAVRIYDDDGIDATLDASNYLVDLSATPARLAMRNAPWPRPGRAIAGIEIDVTAGYGSRAHLVPAPLRQAVLLLAAHWYLHREPVTLGESPIKVPGTVEALLQPYRMVRL